MVVRVVEFSSGGTKLERFLLKNQHTQRKLLNFENSSDFKIDVIKNVNNKIYAPELILFNKKTDKSILKIFN